MSSARGPGGCFPTAAQEHLLRAALLSGPEARSAYEVWRRQLDLQTIDTGSQRLLPLLCRNLAALGVDDPLLPVFRGVQRKTWLDNQILFEKAVPILAVFRAASIPTMVLKGAALVAGFYKDLSLRPMVDLDVLVPTLRAEAAIDVLAAAGFLPERERTPDLVKRLIVPFSHAWSFRDARGRDFDLHWHALHLSCQPDADETFWERAVVTEIRGAPTRMLDPADQLLHVAVHGMWWVSVPSLRWVADAAFILREAGAALDWDRLMAQTRIRRFTVPVRETLAYVHDLLGVPVPREVLGRLRRTHVSALARLEHRASTRPPEDRSPAERFALEYGQSVRRATPLGSSPGPLGHARLLKRFWRLERIRQLPLRPLFERMRRSWRSRARLRRFLPRTFDGAGLPLLAAPPALGRTIDFSLAGDAAAFQRAGWSWAELPDGTWTDGDEAWLALPLETAPARDLCLTVVLQAFLSEAHPLITAEVVVNEVPVANWVFRHGREGAETKSVPVPAAVAGLRNPVEVVFAIHEPATPLSLGLFPDVRRLGLYVRTVRLSADGDSLPSAAG